MKTKLSQRQFELLCDVATNPIYVAHYYPPCVKLVQLGLARFGDYGKLYATSAGLDVIRDQVKDGCGGEA